MTFSKAAVKQSEHYYCQDFHKKRLNNSLIEEIINTRTHITKLQNFATYFQKPYCILCDMNSHKLNSCKKYSSFEEWKKKRREKLNLCSKYTRRKHKNEDCPGRKNWFHFACLKCNSKCHISALCDKHKTTSLYTSFGISQNNGETYILLVVLITFSNGVRRIVVNCILGTRKSTILLL